MVVGGFERLQYSGPCHELSAPCQVPLIKPGDQGPLIRPWRAWQRTIIRPYENGVFGPSYCIPASYFVRSQLYSTPLTTPFSSLTVRILFPMMSQWATPYLSYACCYLQQLFRRLETRRRLPDPIDHKAMMRLLRDRVEVIASSPAAIRTASYWQ